MLEFKDCKSYDTCSWRRSVGSCPAGCCFYTCKDVVHVVRCRNCKHAYTGIYRDFEDKAYCQKIEEGTSILMPMDGFCSYGERKNE